MIKEYLFFSKLTNMKPNIICGAFLMAVLSLLLTSVSVFSEEAVTYIGTNGKITTADQAIYMQKTSASKKLSTVITYLNTENGWKKMGAEDYKMVNDSTYEIKGSGEGVPANIRRSYKKQSAGIWMFRETLKGKLIRTGYTKSLMPLLLEGEVVEYFSNGNLKSKSVYHLNELVSNENWLPSGAKYIDNVFYSVDSVAIFKPGNKVLHQHVLEALKNAKIDVNNVNGSIVVGFVVMENGTIDGIRLLKGLGPKINNVVYQSIYTLPLRGNWTPAQLNGNTVKYFQVFPVNFKTEYNQLMYSKILHDYMEWDRKW